MPQEIIRNIRIENLSSPILTAQILNTAGYGTNHSSLINLDSDDHLQYFNEERGDDRYALKSLIGQPNGIATLNATGLIPASQLPGFVDDVVEYDNVASFPTEGESGKLYIDKEFDSIYRWSGSIYIQTSGVAGTIQGTGTNIYNIRANDENGSIILGDLRGEHSVDFQTSRTESYHVSSGDYSVILGGADNEAKGNYSNVGGYSNSALGEKSTISGGYNNQSTLISESSFIGGGDSNTTHANYSSVLGGRLNKTSGVNSSVVGGYGGHAVHDNSLVWATQMLLTDGSVGDRNNGGLTEFTSIAPNTVNFLAAGLRLVDGNQANGKVLMSDANGTGTWQKPVTSICDLIDVDCFCADSGFGSGGNGNITIDDGSILIYDIDEEKWCPSPIPQQPKLYTDVDGPNSTRRLSQGNTISNGSEGSTISGGVDNNILGNYSTIIGGFGNKVEGDYSIAAGINVDTNFSGVFAFGDSTTTSNDIVANQINQFAIKAAGGLRLIDGQQGANKVLTSDANGVGHWSDPTGSSTLSEVGAGSTTLSDSTYTLTNNVDVKFNSSEGNPIFKLDESKESILIGAESHTITGRENKLYIEGDGNTTLTRTQFAVKNTGPASAAAFDMICSDGGAISIQASGPGYGGGHKAWVYSYEGLPLYLASDGDVPNGGLNDISFSPGGWDNTSVWFKPSGNVGIGTSSPITALHIEKDMGAVGGEGIYVRNTNSGGFSEVVFDNNATTNNGSFVFGYGGTNTGSPNHAYFWNRKSAPIKFGTNNLERLRIDNGGNVGIGTSSPKSKLDVEGRMRLKNTTQNAPLDGKGFEIFYLDSTSRGYLTSINREPNTSVFTPIQFSGSEIAFNTNGTLPSINRMVINVDGNVGIGTETPQGKLHVSNEGDVINSGLISGTAPTSLVSGNTTTVNSTIVAGPNSYNRPVFQGRRSRGTLTSPTSVINNDYLMSFVSSGYDGSASQFGAAVDFFADANATSGNVPTRISLSTGSNSSSRLERLTIKSDGKIGIGTTLPTAKLHALAGSVAEMKFSSGALAMTPALSVGNTNASGKFATLIAGTNGSGLWFDQSGFFSIASASKADYDSNGLGVTQDIRLRIDGSNGNVGIGTLTPTAKLEVAGQVKITGGSPQANYVLTSDATGLASWQPSSGPGGGATIINDLTDVDTVTTPPNNGESLVWNSISSKWEPSLITGGTSGSSTLNATSIVSNDAAKSSYTLTSGIPVKFQDSSGSPLLYIDETNESVSIGTTNVSTAHDTKLYIEGSGGGAGGRTAFKLKNTNVSSASFFAMENTSAQRLNMQCSSSGYTTGAIGAITTTQGLPLRFGTDGHLSTGGSAPITFGAGGYDNDHMTIKGDGKIGIGTSSPETALHISEGGGLTRTWTSFTGTTLLFEQGDTSRNADLTIVSDRSKFAGINFGDQDDQNMGGINYNNSDNSLNFHTNNYDGTFDLTIDNGGNVGIGTASPTSKLEVAGQVKITGGTPGAGKVLTSDSNGLASWVLPTGGSSGTLQTVTNSGNTTTNPIEFNIGGTGQEFIKFNATNSSGRPLTFYDNGSFVGGIDYNFDGDYWSFDVADSTGNRVTDAFTIQSETNNNYVGIGTTSPTSKLHINSDETEAVRIYCSDNTTTNTNAGIRIMNKTGVAGGYASLSFGKGTTENTRARMGAKFGADGTSGSYVFLTRTIAGSLDEKMVISSEGDVGIGTETPSAKLHIEAPAISGRENLIKGSVSDAGDDSFYLGNGTIANSSFVPRFAGYVDSSNSRPSCQFWGLTSSANDASDSSNAGLINFAAGVSDDATDPTNGSLSAASNRKLFTFSNITGTNHMTIAAGGNVGFGTDSPEAKIDVSGRMRFKATTEPAPSTGRGFEAFYSTGSDKSFFISVDRDPSTDILKGIDMRGSSLEFWTGANLNNDAIRLKVEDDGVEFLENVRILNSNDQTGAPAFRCLDSANANFRIQSSLRNGSQNTSFNIDAVGQPGDANREVLVIGYFQGAPNRYKITSNKTGSGLLNPIHFEMDWENPVMVIETDGKVGIGTTTPDKALNITGSGAHSTLKITDDGNGSAAAEMYIGTNDGWSFFNERSTKNFNIRETHAGGSLVNVDRLSINQGGNIGIGTTTPTAKLEVAGQVKITGGNPGTGKVLTSDAGGTASWQEPTGGNGGDDPVAAPTSETSFYIDAGAMLVPASGASPSGVIDHGTNNAIDWWNVDTNEELFSKVAMPPQWDGGDIDVEFFWTSDGASAGDNVRWAAAATSGGNGDVWDTAFSTVTETADDLLIANSEVHVVKASGITPAGTPADGNLLFLKLKRTPTSGQTASVDARLLGVRVHYKNLVHRSWYVNKMGAENAEADTTVLEKTAFVAADAGIIYGVHSGVSTAPSSAGLSVDVKINGVSILSTLGVIGAAQNSSESTSSTPHVLATDPTTFSKGDRISFEISSFGGTGGNGLHTDLLISWAQ